MLSARTKGVVRSARTGAGHGRTRRLPLAWAGARDHRSRGRRRALYRKVMPIARKWNGDLFDSLDEKEKRALGEALDKVIAAITGGDA